MLASKNNNSNGLTLRVGWGHCAKIVGDISSFVARIIVTKFARTIFR